MERHPLDDNAQSHEGTSGKGKPSVFDAIFGDTTAPAQNDSTTPVVARRPVKQGASKKKGASIATQSRGKYTGYGRKGTLKPAWITFIGEFLKNPANRVTCYQAAFPKANAKTAYRRASDLLKRDDIASEIKRRQNIQLARAGITRDKMVDALTGVFEFDFRRFYYTEEEAKALNALALAAGDKTRYMAGDAKKPHHLDDEAARVIDSYEKKSGKYGDTVKLRSTGRLPAAELIAKLKGWVKDDGRPPVIANFHFDFGQKPGSGADIPPIEAVPVHLYGAMGLVDGSTRAKPLPVAEDEHGDPVKSDLPPGYEPQRGVRIKAKGRELADDLAGIEGANRE